MNAPPPPPRRRHGNPLFLLIGVIVIALVGYAAFEHFYRPGLPPAPVVERPAPAETITDSPGASDLYGFTREELNQYGPRDTIIAALQNTTIEAIDDAAQSGDALGRTLQCLAYAYGEGHDRNLGLARIVCEQASGQNQALATYQLSLFHRGGLAGLTANAAEADRLLARAASRRDPRAQLDVARNHLDGGQMRQGFEGVVASAEQGYRDAQFALGEIYEQGRGVAPDNRSALLWYERAARSGSSDAHRQVGIFYEEARGVSQDYSRAREEYSAASAAGDGIASLRLGRLYERGQGGTADIAAARRYFQRAADQGIADGRTELDRVGRDN